MLKCNAKLDANMGKKGHWKLIDATATIEKGTPFFILANGCPVLVLQTKSTGHAIPVHDIKRIIAGKDDNFSFRSAHAKGQIFVTSSSGNNDVQQLRRILEQIAKKETKLEYIVEYDSRWGIVVIEKPVCKDETATVMLQSPAIGTSNRTLTQNAMQLFNSSGKKAPSKPMLLEKHKDKSSSEINIAKTIKTLPFNGALASYKTPSKPYSSNNIAGLGSKRTDSPFDQTSASDSSKRLQTSSKFKRKEKRSSDSSYPARASGSQSARPSTSHTQVLSSRASGEAFHRAILTSPTTPSASSDSFNKAFYSNTQSSPLAPSNSAFAEKKNKMELLLIKRETQPHSRSSLSDKENFLAPYRGHNDGFKNMGQTCYVAATLQMLFFSPLRGKLKLI